MPNVFLVELPYRPFGLTAIQLLISLTVLLVILQNAMVVRNRRTGIGNITNNITCGEPPSTLGDLIFYKQQGDAAFYVCPNGSVYVDVPLNCPIIYCQANGTFSTPDVATYQSRCRPADETLTVVDTSGQITTPNYPTNFIPTLIDKTITWSIMTPGTNLVFRIEDFDIDAVTDFTFICGDSATSFLEADETTLLGQELTCNRSCAVIALSVLSGPGGRGFNISFRTQ